MVEIVIYKSDESGHFIAYVKRRPDISTTGPTVPLALVSLAAAMIEVQNEEGELKKLEGNA